MHRAAFLAIALSGGSLAITLAARDAYACGGCFHETPIGGTESPSVITDHRMVLAVSPSLTTLWDQVEYAGDPTGFAWVLPIRGQVVVGVGSDLFLDALDQQTAPVIVSPARTCPSRLSGGGGGGGGGAGCGCASSSSASPPASMVSDTGKSLDDTGVFVTNRSVVGPYETVQVHGTDAGSILAWLLAHDYQVPKELEPILVRYVTEGFDFLAVRLRPSVGVRAMRPIRVSWGGASPQLPLRMVAAGVGERVGIKLFVIGDGRWRTANFPTFAVNPALVTWDFVRQGSDYTKVRETMAQLWDGRAFTLESSILVSASSIPFDPPFDADIDAGADTSIDDAADDTDDADSGSPPPPPPDTGTPPPGVRPDDLDARVAFGGHLSLRVTRLRTDLPSKYLDTDLILEADDSQSVLPVRLQLTNSKGFETVCPQAAQAPSQPSSSTCEIMSAGSTDTSDYRIPVAVTILALMSAFGRRVARRRR